MKRYLCYIIILIVTSLFGISKAEASILYTSHIPQIGIDQEFSVEVLIDADEPINTIEQALLIPSQFEITRVQDSGSIINLWVERPRIDATTNTVLFSGLVPGGFSGRGGKLVTLTLKAVKTGEGRFAFDATGTRVLLNNGEGTADPKFQTRTSSIVVSQEKVTIAEPRQDTEAPESFTPLVIQDSLLEDGTWVVVFQTQDKNSGLKEYQIQEFQKRTPDAEAWEKAESPYVLKDQSRSSYVFVKAVDYQGNERIELIGPEGMSQGMKVGLLILLIILCLIIVRSVYLRYGKKRS